jgi:hypothetical protein
MKDDMERDALREAERHGGRAVRRAIAFGVIAATLQMAVVLWLFFG